MLNHNVCMVADDRKRYTSRQHRNVKLKNIKSAGFREDLGHYCKSTWAANYARILKHLNIEYEYRCKRFELRKNGSIKYSYTPDFYIPSSGEYIEVRKNMTKNFKKIMEMFKKLIPLSAQKLQIINKDKYTELMKKFGNDVDNLE